MMKSENVKALIKKELKFLTKANVNDYGTLRAYSMKGQLWETNGYLLERGRNTLVYEILSHKKLRVPVLRIYWYNPMRVKYRASMARKNYMDTARVASQEFISIARELKKKPNYVSPYDKAKSKKLPKELRSVIELAYSPIPPPLNA